MSLEEIVLLGKDLFLELIVKIMLGIMGGLDVPSGEALIVPELYSIRLYGELMVHGELVAYGDVEVV